MTKTCPHCQRQFTDKPSKVEGRIYCSRSCMYAAKTGIRRVEHAAQTCPTCSVTFGRKNWQASTYCSVKCSRLGIRKEQREDRTDCYICGEMLTPRQISNQSKYCSRRCFGEGMKQWHAVPENKETKRVSGAKTAAMIQKSRTSIEVKLADALDRAGIPHTPQFPITNRHGTIFICDFAIPERMLIIEADGDYWHNLPNVVKKDAHKDKYLKAAGYTVLRFSETQINQDADECIRSIQAYL